MAKRLNIQGSVVVEPVTGVSDGRPSITTPQDNYQILKAAKLVDEYTLTSDAPVSISLENLQAAHFLAVRVVGGGCKVTFTNTYGTQNMWCNPWVLLQMNDTVAPITALQITRPAAVQVVVTILMGEKA